MSDDECEATCWIASRGIDAICVLPPGHDGLHWDHLEGWEW